MKVVTEIMDLSLLDEVMEYADILQVGSRNMQNFFMLSELGKVNKPIMLKRGMQSTVKEWLLAAEYILSGGNEQVILCERGIRSFDNETRNVMDVGVIPLIKELSHLPIIADPSHGTGASSRVIPLALASAVAGAHGLLIEVHPNPEQALSDKYQAINYDAFASLQNQLNALLQVMKGGEITPVTVL
jgi:3-deoxy-7-phosphoheptulonate synthase